jgi:antitoxin MazE
MMNTKLAKEIEIEAQDNHIVIRPAALPRQGWEEAFRAMAKNGHDQLLDTDLNQTEQEQEDWQW